jgi:L-2-hydroxyglutarate oxidase LhgO
VSRQCGDDSPERIVPFRGDYYTLTPDARHLVNGLVYPVPDPRFPFLGVHLTKRVDGEVLAGPNAVLAFAREGYRRRDVRPRELCRVLADPAFRRLARRYWRTGVLEMWRDVSKRAFLRELQRYVPTLDAHQLRFGPSGVRAQALDPDGTLVDDFRLGGDDRVLTVRNAPSPAATASLAIASVLADTAQSRFVSLTA